MSKDEYDYKSVCGELVRVILSIDELFESEFERVLFVPPTYAT